MKSTELMIGDWVYVTSICGWECSPLEQQIRGIEYNSYKGDDYCDWASTDCDDEVSLSYIEPIPLTAEILEKNGFWRVCYVGYFQHNSINNLGINIGENVRLDHFIEDPILEVRYVHELQHALRLFELDELADNFKI